MKHEILTSNGIPVQMIRYFSYQTKNYLIFTKESDADGQGYVTIHISEVVNENGLSGVTVDDQISKELIKNITNANKNNIPLDIIDLDYNDIDGINLLGDKAYRVLPNYVEILSKNQPIFEKQNNIQESIVENINNNALNSSIEQSIADNNVAIAPSQSFNINNDLNNNVNVDNSPFNINQPTINNTNIDNVDENGIVPETEDNTDYKKMYLEQAELIKNLNSEIEIYKNKIEMLKSIINN